MVVVHHETIGPSDVVLMEDLPPGPIQTGPLNAWMFSPVGPVHVAGDEQINVWFLQMEDVTHKVVDFETRF